MIDFRLTARRNINAASVSAKAGTRRGSTSRLASRPRIIGELYRGGGPNDVIEHVTRRRQDNILESDRAAPNRLTNPMRGFRSLRSATAAPEGIEVIRSIKKGQVHDLETGVAGEASPAAA